MRLIIVAASTLISRSYINMCLFAAVRQMHSAMLLEKPHNETHSHTAQRKRAEVLEHLSFGFARHFCL